MYCQYCKTKLEEDAKVCHVCGNPAMRQGAKELDEEETRKQIQDFSKAREALDMADRYHISSVFFFVFGAICAFFTLLMAVAPKIENMKGVMADKEYCQSMALLYGVTALLGFLWAGTRHFGKKKMLKERDYSTGRVLFSSVLFCILLLIRIFCNPHVNNAADVLFLFLSAIVFLYEIFFVAVHAWKGRAARR